MSVSFELSFGLLVLVSVSHAGGFMQMSRNPDLLFMAEFVTVALM